MFAEWKRGCDTIALIEYKEAPSRDVNKESITAAIVNAIGSDGNLVALIRLGERAGVPVLLVKYSHDLKNYKIAPLSELAESMLAEYGIEAFERISQKQYSDFLYKIRGMDIPS